MGINERLSMLRISALAFLFLFSSLLLMSCDTQTEGCLDFRALRVDVDADDACSDCCIYPSLALQFIPARFNADTLLKVLQSSDTLISGANVGVAPQLAFYLHDIFLISADGERLEMMDTFTVFTDGEDPNFLYERSVLRVSPFRQTRYELGTLLEEKTFVAVEAKLGLPDILSSANVDLQPSSSPLFRNTDTLLVASATNNLLDAAFKFEKLDMMRDSFELVDASGRSVLWELDAPLDYLPSYSASITLGLPVDTLLSFNPDGVNGDIFVEELLLEAKVLQVELSRPL